MERWLQEHDKASFLGFMSLTLVVLLAKQSLYKLGYLGTKPTFTIPRFLAMSFTLNIS
jgi:hypothetical protein